MQNAIDHVDRLSTAGRTPGRIALRARDPLPLVRLEERDQTAGAQPEVGEQGPGSARVLARDDVGVAQGGEHAQRHVLEVPDRRRADDEPAGAHAAAAAADHPSHANSAAPSIPDSSPNRDGTIRTTSPTTGLRPSKPPSRSTPR